MGLKFTYSYHWTKDFALDGLKNPQSDYHFLWTERICDPCYGIFGN